MALEQGSSDQMECQMQVFSLRLNVCAPRVEQCNAVVLQHGLQHCKWMAPVQERFLVWIGGGAMGWFGGWGRATAQGAAGVGLGDLDCSATPCSATLAPPPPPSMEKKQHAPLPLVNCVDVLQELKVMRCPRRTWALELATTCKDTTPPPCIMWGSSGLHVAVNVCNMHQH